MIGTALGFLAGDLLLQQCSQLPALYWAWFMLVAALALILLRFRFNTVLAGMCAGFAWSLLYAHTLLLPEFPPELEGVDLVIEGRIAGVPESGERHIRFAFDPLTIEGPDGAIDWRGRLLISWYETSQLPRPGETWRLKVRLKRPWGFMNPGGFDYEAWLFQQQLRARGYVRDAPHTSELPINARSDDAPGVKARIDRARQTISGAIAGHAEWRQGGLIRALTVGERSGIETAQWDVLRRTGTSHLMAISGLHIGLIAGLVFAGWRRLWSRFPGWTQRLPAPQAAAYMALAAAGVYAALAGFSIPTQRALIMAAVLLSGVILLRRQSAARLLAQALLAVLLFDPLAVLSAGFWLSFGAVAVILLDSTGRLKQAAGWRVWLRWGRMQWIVALGLAPLLLWQFQQLPLASPLANLLAIPWVSFISVPLSLLGAVALQFWVPLGELLLGLADLSLRLIWTPLHWLSGWEGGQWTGALRSPWLLAGAVCGTVLLLLPRGLPGRWLGLLLLLPVLVPASSSPGHGRAELTLLDVGQGLSAVVRTANHVLVYDTGPRFNDSFDAGRMVVLPYLRYQGIDHVDTLIISHGDLDHRGGAAALVADMPVMRILSSVTEQQSGWSAEPCERGQSWRWDGVEFRLLHPPAGADAGSRNNRSCVLRISAGTRHILLPGDIQDVAELELVRTQADLLAAEVLVAPHHGSRTSSTDAFLAQVRPQYVLFAAGYRNRFGFPHAQVLQRYRRFGATMLNSAEHGAVTLMVDPEQGVQMTETYRQSAMRYWHSR